MNSRLQALVAVLDTTSFHQCIVFTNSRGAGQRAATLLDRLGFTSRFVCGDQPQKDRLAAVAALRALKLRVLVSSDLTSRGIDVDTINLVVNLEMPPSHETYLHRVGRTGRFGTLGVSVTIVGPDEVGPLSDLAKALVVEIPAKPEVIPAELYHFEIKGETEEAQSLEALVGARRDAEEKGETVDALMAELSIPEKPSVGAGGTNPSVGRAVEKSTKRGAGEGGVYSTGGLEAEGGGGRRQTGWGGEGAAGGETGGGGGGQAGAGRHLGCLSVGSTVEVLVERDGEQVMSLGHGR